MNRRDFLAGAATLAGGAALRAAAPSDRIRVGVIGLGWRGRDHMLRIPQVAGVEVVAFADPDAERMGERAAEFEQKIGSKPALYQDLRRVLEDKSIDAITVATPNHWHALAAVWGCQAGKHVYVEKPVCHDFHEGEQMVAASRRYNRIVQGGTQRRSNVFIRKAIQALHEGVIGEIYMARCIHFQKRDSIGFKSPEPPPATLNWDIWVGPGPMQPFHRNLVHYNWHWFWDYGNGEMGNNGVHFIDIARWGMNKQLPVRTYSTGGRFGYKDQAQTPNTQLTAFTYEDGTELVSEIRGRFSNDEAGLSGGAFFYGSKGRMAFVPKPHEHFEVFLQDRKVAEPDLGRVDELGLREDNEVGHFENFFNAVRANKRELQTAEINETFLSTAHCLFGNIAYRLGREIHFDPQTRHFSSDTVADAMLGATGREPYIVPTMV